MIKTLFLCFVLVCITSAQSFAGTWTDNTSGYGGSTYICVDGNNLYAAYSQYGIAQGTINGLTVTGNWYEVGGDILDQATTGTFTWTINSAGDSFSGSYTNSGSSSNSDWSETRVDSDSATIAECAQIASSGSIEGSWISANYVLDLCQSTGNTYSASYNETSSDYGYDSGVTYQGDLIGSGSYDSNNGNNGVRLYFLLADGTLGSFSWTNSGNNAPSTSDFGTSNQSYDVYTYSSTVSDSTCDRYDNLYSASANNNNVSGAVTMAISFAVSFVCLCVLF